MGAQAARPDSGRFAMQLAFATPLGDLMQWFEHARPGERAVYASGFTLPREAASVKRARELQEAGSAHLVADRDPADPRRQIWLIEKRAAPPASREGRGRHHAAAAPRPDLTREQMRFVMRRLRDAAAAGLECPSYAAIAKDLCLRPGSASRRRARYLLQRLEKEKKIAVEPGSATQPPVVTILMRGKGCGKSTRSAGK